MRLSGDFLGSRAFRWSAVGVSAVAGAALAVSGYLLFYPTFAFHVFAAAALIVVLTMPALLVLRDERRKRHIDDMLPRFMEDMAESHEAGMTLLKALEASSKRRYGPITGELRHLAAQLSWGVEFEAAFASFSSRIDTELTAKTTAILLEAMRLGGDLKAAFHSTASFVREVIQLRNERESQLRPYMIVIYVSNVIFMAIIMILYQSFFLSMASGSAGSGGFMSLPMSLEGYKVILFDLVVVEALFGGITAGKLSGGRALTGLKHSVTLLVVVSVVFGLFFLDPIPPAITDVEFAPSTPSPVKPVRVAARITDPTPGSGVQEAYLVWTSDGWRTNETVKMDYSRTSELWEAQIPPSPEEAEILFLLTAMDSSGNSAVNDNGRRFFGYRVAAGG